MHYELKQAFLSKVKNHVKVVHESRTQVIVLNFGVIDLLPLPLITLPLHQQGALAVGFITQAIEIFKVFTSDANL